MDSLVIYSRATPHHHTGGMETVSWSLARELARHVSRVEIVTTAVVGKPARFVADGLHVHALPGTRPGRYSRGWWRGSRQDWRERRDPPDAVLSVSAGAFSVVTDRDQHPRVPFVMQVHGTAVMEMQSKLRAPTPRAMLGLVRNAGSLARELRRFGRFDQIVTVGDNVAQSMRSVPTRWSTDRVQTIENAIDPTTCTFDPARRGELRSAIGVDEGTLLIASIGRLHRQKRVDRLLRAAALLHRSHAGDVRLLVVGDGPEERALRELARGLGIEGLVHFTGRVEPAQINAYYSAADVLAMTTSRREGLPMALLEGLGAGLPCVVPRGAVGGGSLADILIEVDASDPAALGEALLLAGQGASSRTSRLPERFHISQCASRYLELFESVAAHIADRGTHA